MYNLAPSQGVNVLYANIVIMAEENGRNEPVVCHFSRKGKVSPFFPFFLSLSVITQNSKLSNCFRFPHKYIYNICDDSEHANLVLLYSFGIFNCIQKNYVTT